jgi:GcrA cell cycle regulator
MIIFWTPTKIKLLKQYWADGLFARQIGAKLGATRNAVIGKVHRLALPPRIRETKGPTKSMVKPKPVPVPEPKPEPKSTKAIPPKLIVNPVIPEGDVRTATLALTTDSCRWPLGDPYTDRFMYCVNKKIADYPYCEEHCHKAYHEFGLPRYRRRVR